MLKKNKNTVIRTGFTLKFNADVYKCIKSDDNEFEYKLTINDVFFIYFNGQEKAKRLLDTIYKKLISGNEINLTKIINNL